MMETEQGEDAPMREEPELVEDADAFDDTNDLVAYVKREANLKIDRIKAEHDGKVEAMSRKIQSQLKKQADQISQLSAKVDQGKDHTERARQQLIQEGHKNDGCHAEHNRKMEEMIEMVRGGRAEAQTPSPAAGSSAQRKATSPSRGAGDPCMLRANTHRVPERGQGMEAVQRFAEHTTVPPEAICAAGLATSRNFVVKVMGDAAIATRRVDELFEALTDQARPGNGER